MTNNPKTRRTLTAEERRLEESRDRKAHWKRWGPYLSERAWGTVGEDYSAGGTAWDYLPHDHARSRAYRWKVFGGIEKFQTDPNWQDIILFHEYFHGDNGAGIGANHQTGWTSVVAKLLQQSGG